MNFSDLFIPPDKQVVKRTFMVSEEDYNLIKSVYPEHGFLAYYPGYFFTLLADELRKNKIHDINDRFQSAEFAAVSRVLSHFRTALVQNRGNDRRATERVCEGNETDHRKHAVAQQGAKKRVEGEVYEEKESCDEG